jgi:hypothetical protein
VSSRGQGIVTGALGWKTRRRTAGREKGPSPRRSDRNRALCRPAERQGRPPGPPQTSCGGPGGLVGRWRRSRPAGGATVAAPVFGSTTKTARPAATNNGRRLSAPRSAPRVGQTRRRTSPRQSQRQNRPGPACRRGAPVRPVRPVFVPFGVGARGVFEEEGPAGPASGTGGFAACRGQTCAGRGTIPQGGI